MDCTCSMPARKVCQVFWKHLIYNGVLLICSLLLAVVLVEGMFRLFPGLLPWKVRQRLIVAPDRMGVSHPYIGHLHTPNNAFVIATSDFKLAHHTDAHGFRNPWPWPDKADIVVVGDSLAFGYGVNDEEAWPTIIARAFPQLRLVNQGLIGAGPEQYARVYETFGLPLRPRLLLVGFFIGNDFWDAGLYDRWLKAGANGNYMVWRNSGGDQGFGFSLSQLKGILQRNSIFYNLLRHTRNTYRNWRLSEPQILRLANGAQLQLQQSAWAELISQARPDQPEFQLVLEALKRIQSIAGKHDTHVLVVIQPSKEWIYLPFLTETIPDPSIHLRAALDRLGVSYLNLAPAFQRQARAGEQLFFERDGHPNRQGYRLIACEIVAHLKEKGAAYGLHEIAVGGSSGASFPLIDLHRNESPKDFKELPIPAGLSLGCGDFEPSGRG